MNKGMAGIVHGVKGYREIYQCRNGETGWGGQIGRQAEDRIWGGITSIETSEIVIWKPATVGTS